MSQALLERPTATCKVCAAPFVQFNTMQSVVCSIKCARAIPVINRRAERADKAETRRKLEALKPRSKWMAEAQAEVNRYVRLRDAALPCASCDRPATWDGQWHASHFRSVGAASAVRFHLWNIHKACSICNNHLSGNIIEFEPRLRARIGVQKVEWLRTQNQRATYTVEYLKRLKALFARRCRRQEKRNAMQG